MSATKTENFLKSGVGFMQGIDNPIRTGLGEILMSGRCLKFLAAWTVCRLKFRPEFLDRNGRPNDPHK